MYARGKRELARAAGAVMESLERRRLLSGITLSNGVLSIAGEPDSANHLAVDSIGGGLIAALDNGQSQVFATSQIKQIQITGGQVPSSIAIDKSIDLPITVYSYNASDSITTGDPHVTLVQSDSSAASADQPAAALNPNVLTAVITADSPTDLVPGQAMYVNAMNSVLAGGSPLTDTFQWNFGDATAASQYNQLNGFNAAHVYNSPGEYTISLTITDANGNSSVATLQVNVGGDPPQQTIYVSSSGNDANDGTTPDDPVQSIARVQELLGENTQVLFQDGETFPLTSSLYVGFSNVSLGSYGTGAQPVIFWTGGQGYNSMIQSSAATYNLTITGLTFDSIDNQDTNEDAPTAITPSGNDVAIVGDTFLNVDYAINLNMCPTGVLVQNCSAPQVTYSGQVLPVGDFDTTNPDVTGLRDYLVWTQGSDITILGNYAANSTRQHIVRVGGADLVNIQYNNLTNLSRTAIDPIDISKDTIDLQMGTYAFIANNTLQGGPTGVGPLTTQPTGFDYAVFTDNVLDVPLNIEPGASNVLVEDNVSNVDNISAFYVNGFDTTNNRGVVNATITGNTDINNGQTGNFVVLDGPAQDVTLTDNLMVAPNLEFNSLSAPVLIETDDLSSFSQISGNVWPLNTAAPSDTAAENFIGPIWMNSYVTAAQWNAMPQVSGDSFESVVLPSDYEEELAQFTQTGIELFAGANS